MKFVNDYFFKLVKWIEYRKINCVLVVLTLINLFPCVSEYARKIVSYEL